MGGEEVRAKMRREEIAMGGINEEDGQERLVYIPPYSTDGTRGTVLECMVVDVPAHTCTTATTQPA
jgi:hypothetical protein